MEEPVGQQQPAAQQNPSAQPQPQVQPAQPVPAAGLTPEQEVAVNDLIAITGKSKDQCTLALRAAQGNPDVAYEILSSGVPLNNAMLSGAGVGAGAPGQEDFGDEYGDEGDEDSAMPGGANPFAALASNPNFAMIRQRIL